MLITGHSFQPGAGLPCKVVILAIGLLPHRGNEVTAMVSSIDTVRIWSMQTAIRVFKETLPETDAGQGSLASRIISSYGMDSDDGDDATTYSLADILTGGTQSGSEGAVEEPAMSTDIETASFMAGLKAKLKDLEATPDTSAQAAAMLKALDAGTLTVTDAVNGREVTAWDVEAQNAVPQTATSTDTDDWSTFLREHLARASGGTYQRNADQSHIDRATGKSAYFGMIGDQYYYLTWTAASGSSPSAQA
jgi:hypothetical protein